MAEHDVQRTEPKRDPCGKEPRESTCVAVVFYTEVTHVGIFTRVYHLFKRNLPCLKLQLK